MEGGHRRAAGLAGCSRVGPFPGDLSSRRTPGAGATSRGSQLVPWKRRLWATPWSPGDLLLHGVIHSFCSFSLQMPLTGTRQVSTSTELSLAKRAPQKTKTNKKNGVGGESAPTRKRPTRQDKQSAPTAQLLALRQSDTCTPREERGAAGAPRGLSCAPHFLQVLRREN